MKRGKSSESPPLNARQRWREEKKCNSDINI